jgi:tight adherence protein B
VRRAAVGTVVGALALLVSVSVALAAPGAKIAGTDMQGYPRIVVNVVTATPVSTAPRLRENGVPVAGLEAVNLGQAKSVVLAIDNSQSMRGAALRDAAGAARTFVDAKAPGDRVSVVSFGRHPLQLTGFSTSAGQADAALQGLQVDRTPGTALYDAVAASAHALEASTQPGHVIVVLTDGKDVSSLASIDAAAAAARKADAAIYPIGIESKDFDPTPLRTLADETGGTYHGAGSTAELQQVYATIAGELSRTWRLGYETAARPGDKLTLTASAPGSGVVSRTVELPAAFGGGSQAPGSSLLPSVVFSPIGTIVISLLVAALVLAAIYSLVRLRRGSWVQQRLAAHVAHTKQNGLGHGDRLSFLKALFSVTESALSRHSKWRSIERLLTRGDVPLRPAEFLWLMVGCGVVGGFVFAVAGAPAILALLAIPAFAVLPYAFVSFKVRRRVKAFEDQLPDLLTTIAASLKAGHSFKHGLQAVVDEAHPPASIELKRVLTEAGLGRPLDDALSDMAERVGSENFAFSITAVTIQRQVGGSLATLFDMVSETVRNRQQFARKIRSLTAMGRMSAYTLVGIPFFILGMVSLLNPGFLRPLYHTHAGHILMFVGLGMMTVGSLMLKKIVSFRG